MLFPFFSAKLPITISLWAAFSSNKALGFCFGLSISFPFQQSSGSSQLMSSNGIGNVLGSGLGSGMGSGMSQTGLNVPAMPLLLSGENGTPEAINALRNQQYLAVSPTQYSTSLKTSWYLLLQQLARHQSELTRYNAKQLEYLDQQRRYQQSMIDHQAGAAVSYRNGERKTPSPLPLRIRFSVFVEER